MMREIRQERGRVIEKESRSSETFSIEVFFNWRRNRSKAVC